MFDNSTCLLLVRQKQFFKRWTTSAAYGRIGKWNASACGRTLNWWLLLSFNTDYTAEQLGRLVFHLIKQTIAHIEVIKILCYSEALASLFSVGCEPTDESTRILQTPLLHWFFSTFLIYMFIYLFIWFVGSGKHGHVLPCEEEEVFAEEHVWNAGASQSHEQIKGPWRGGRNWRYMWIVDLWGEHIMVENKI